MAKTRDVGCRTGLERELWRLWEEGWSTLRISRAVGRSLSWVYGVFRRAGGIRPRERVRSARSLVLSEREAISRGLSAGRSSRSIASELGRPVSTVSREVSRNGGREAYRAVEADRAAWRRSCRPKPRELSRRPRLRRLVEAKLSAWWSPEQISRWLRVEFADDASMRISHETIYRSLFVQARGTLKKELVRSLRSGRLMRRARRSSGRGREGGGIPDAVSICERPASVEDRAVPGHWEGDLLLGSSGTQIVTLVERRTRFVMLLKVDSKETSTVVSALSRGIRRLPSQLRRTLTWDRGTELSGHRELTLSTRMEVYFCDPRSPWQRGTNENTNGLLRQYFPKGTDLSVHTQRDLDRAARSLNTRPRATLEFRTPAAIFAENVASTG